MTDLILEFLRNNPKTLPLLLMRKFKITHHEAKRIRSMFDSGKDNELQEALVVYPRSHIERK
jgi:hypothetical protein